MARRKKMSAFWKVFIAFCIVFAVALGGWLYFLTGWLGDYEAAQPKYVAEETYKKHFEKFDAKAYVDMCFKEGSVLETAENIAAYLEDVTKDADISYKKVSSGMEDTYKYIVLAGKDEVKFASFTLVEDKEAKGSFKQYKAEGFEIYTDSTNKFIIEAPKGYVVKINGIALGDNVIVENDIATPSCDYMPEGVSGLYYTKYLVSGLLSEPAVEITDKNGTVAAVEKNDNCYKAGPVYDALLEAEYKDWILDGVEKYAKYSQYDSKVNATGFGQVAPYFDSTSELYESIRTVENMFVIEYDKYEFVDMKASEFVRYDDNTFSCRVQYTQNLYKGSKLYDDFVDQTLYLRKVEGEYKIYEMQVN